MPSPPPDRDVPVPSGRSRPPPGSATGPGHAGPYGPGHPVLTLLRVVTMLPLASVLVIALVTTGALVVGWTPGVVTSESMAPWMRPGDIILAGPASPAGLERGDIVVFDRVETPSGEITHRLVGRQRSGAWVTKGDANEAVDPRPVAPEEISREVRMVIPRLGLPSLWLARGDVVPLVVLLTILGLSVWGTVVGIRAVADP